MARDITGEEYEYTPHICLIDFVFLKTSHNFIMQSLNEGYTKKYFLELFSFLYRKIPGRGSVAEYVLYFKCHGICYYGSVTEYTNVFIFYDTCLQCDFQYNVNITQPFFLPKKYILIVTIACSWQVH